MAVSRGAVVLAAGVLAGSLVLAGCGGHAGPRPAAGAAATAPTSDSPGTPTTAGATGPTRSPSTGTARGAGSSTAPGGAPAQQSAVTGKVTAVRGLTATVSAAGGDVAIAWSAGTVIIDTVAGKASDVAVGACVLVLPRAGGPSPTARAITAGLVRVVAGSPSCPLVPGTATASGKAPKHRGGAGDAGGTITAVGGQGVIGTVTAVRRTGFTLRSRDNGSIRTLTVSTPSGTEYRKAGAHPRAAVETGRCATVWGTDHRGSRLVATSIRMSDPVDGTCAPLS